MAEELAGRFERLAPLVTSSFLFLVVRPGAPSSFLLLLVRHLLLLAMHLLLVACGRRCSAELPNRLREAVNNKRIF